MKKKVLLFFATAMLSIMGAKADVIPSSYYQTVGEGTYLIYNINQDKFLKTAELHEDHHALLTTPQQITLTSDGSTGFYLSGNAGKYLKSGYYGGLYLWPNSDSGVSFYFTEVSPGSKTYKVSTVTTETLNGKAPGTYYITDTEVNLDDEASAGTYALISASDYKTFRKTSAIPSEYYSTPAAGTYYLYDMLSNQFLNTSSKAFTSSPVAVTLTEPETGKFTISAGSDYLKIGTYKNMYLWNGNSTDTYWTFEKDGDEYYIKTSEFSEGNSYITSNKPWYLYGDNAYYVRPGCSQWALITEANYYKYLADQTTIPSTYYTTTPSAGTYYLYNIAQNGFIYRGGDGNYAGLKATPATLTLISNGSGAFYIKFDDGKYLKTGTANKCYVWTDATDESYAWTFESFHEVSGLFTLKCYSSDESKDMYLYSNGIGARGVNGGTIPDVNRTNYAWALISEANYTAWQNSFTLNESTDFSIARDIYNVNPTVTKSMTAGVWNTFVVPFDMAIPSGWTVKEPTAFDGSTLTFGDASSIVAGKPYIVKPTEAVTSFSATGVTLKKDLNNTTVGDLTMTGTYEQIAAIDYSTKDCYVIGLKDGVSSLYKVNSSVSLKPFRAYFTVDGGAAARITLNFGDETTGIETMNHSPLTVNQYFDLQGRRVAQPTKGLYIINGKKVMVK
jgi:hypothetical protein